LIICRNNRVADSPMRLKRIDWIIDSALSVWQVAVSVTLGKAISRLKKIRLVGTETRADFGARPDP
jgi:hypothetical protein